MTHDERVQCIADELEIRNLVPRIAQLFDDGKLDEYIALWTEDGVWDGGAAFGVRQGRETLIENARRLYATGMSGPGAHSRHIVAPGHVRVDGDRAYPHSTMVFYVDCEKAPTARFVSLYQDELRRTPEGWRLACRVVVRA
jgi:hypothetical protein